MTDAELSRQEWYDERAAILEFMGGMLRGDAEAAARAQMQDYFGRRSAPASHGDGAGARVE